MSPLVTLTLENDYRIPLGHADVSIDAISFTPEQGALLKVAAGRHCYISSA